MSEKQCVIITILNLTVDIVTVINKHNTIICENNLVPLMYYCIIES